MPVQTDYPTGIGAYDKWALSGAASKLAAVASNDGDTSILYQDSGGALHIQLFTFPLLDGVADPVTAATIYARVREFAPGVGGRHFSFLWNSVASGVNLAASIHTTRPNYTLQSYATSGAGLGLSAVNGEHGFQMTAAGGPEAQWEVWVTECYRVVDFTYSASSGSADHFAHLVGSLIGAIGASLLLRDMPALARSIYRRTGTLIKPSEYADALAAWRRERHVRLVGA